MTRRYQEALAIWQSLGDEAELANAYYNASFTFAFPEVTCEARADSDPDKVGLRYLNQAREIYHRVGDRRGEANALWGIGNYEYFRGFPGNGVTEFRETIGMFREVGDLTMEAWGLHMLGTSLLRNGDIVEAREHIEHAVRHFYAAGDASGLTLTLDDLSAVAVADGDLPRAARLRGAARNLTMETGTGLAVYVEDTFEIRRPAGDPLAHVGRRAGSIWGGRCRLDARRGGHLRPRGRRPDRAGDSTGGVGSRMTTGSVPCPALPIDDPDPGLVTLMCANCVATLDERKCKLISRCGYFLCCSDDH